MTERTFDNFILGYWQGRYRLLKSTGVDKVLSPESLHYLQQLGGHIDQPMTTATLLCKDKLFAVSYLKPGKDELGRATMWNHTILIPCDALMAALKSVWDKAEQNHTFITGPNDKLSSPLPPVSLEIN
jgi:hypothetical protein